MSILKLIGRKEELFNEDIFDNEAQLTAIVSKSRFLVIGGAGSIGQAVAKQIFKRNPLKLHVVDISENNLVELVRDIRSSYGYIDGEFRTFALDIGSIEYDEFIRHDGKYDYVLNLSALKHVRSEKDQFTLMRMVNVNIINTKKTIQQSIQSGVKKYFCVSTDKAANPVNMMGASKRIMEMFLMQLSKDITISTARFANVAFSDGSLLHGFRQRILKQQPIVAPNDIKRYFVTPQESGELCLLSCIFGENRDIFFPKLSDSLHLIKFSEIAKKFLIQNGFEPYICESEEEARDLATILPDEGKWPCFFSVSDTAGEKDFEEFYTNTEELDLTKYKSIGVIKNKLIYNLENLNLFEKKINYMKINRDWTKEKILKLFSKLIPEFEHKETGKNLDNKM